ncbi:MAG TPA: hypothetical protein VIH22_15435 [Cyclobacteriaceae bacterium]|jgi:hypothetical protein
MKINEAWHRKNRMPPNATLDDRINWHIEHQKHCKCRGIPEKLKEEMSKRGIIWKNRSDQED